MHGTYKSTGGDHVEPKEMYNSFYKNVNLLTLQSYLTQIKEDKCRLKKMEEEAEKLREKIDDHSAKLKSLQVIETESDITTLITVVEQICTGKYCGNY